MPCPPDPFEVDLARANDALADLAASVEARRVALADALATLDTVCGGVSADALATLHARAAALHGTRVRERFTWGDMPLLPGSDASPGGPWPDTSALSDGTRAARDLDAALEVLTCDVRAHLLARVARDPAMRLPAALAERVAVQRALHRAHRREDRSAWLRAARSHRAELGEAIGARVCATVGDARDVWNATREALDVGDAWLEAHRHLTTLDREVSDDPARATRTPSEALAAWDADLARVEARTDEELLAMDALPRLPWEPARG